MKCIEIKFIEYSEPEIFDEIKKLTKEGKLVEVINENTYRIL